MDTKALRLGATPPCLWRLYLLLCLMLFGLVACSTTQAPRRLSATELQELATELRTHPNPAADPRFQQLTPEDRNKVVELLATQGTNDAVRQMNLSDFAKKDTQKGADAPKK